MLRRFAKSADLRRFADFVSPAFFRVMPARSIIAEVSKLRSLKRDDELYSAMQSQRKSDLSAIDLGIEINDESGLQETGNLPNVERARRILSLYFFQILSGGDVCLLDLRASSFSLSGETLYWNPKPWITRWEPEFLDGLQHLYRGFYENDDAAFQLGLKQLGMKDVEDAFRERFAHAGAMRFTTKSLTENFHTVFVACREKKVTLNRGFLSLGLYLATLYDHLEGLDVEVDVSEAYERVSKVLRD